MAGKKEEAAQQQEQQAPFVCTGDCMNCGAGQWKYCASQNAYYAMRMMQDMTRQMNEMRNTISTLSERLSAVEEISRSTGTAQRVEPQEN